MSRSAPPLFVVVLTLAGCVKFEDGETGAGTEGPATMAATATDSAGMTSAGATTAPDEPTTGGTGGVGGECSLWEQDCNAGMKCVPYDSMHTGVVDATRCVEVSEPPRAAGDPCTSDDQCAGEGSCQPATPESGDGCSALCTLESECGDGRGKCGGKLHFGDSPDPFRKGMEPLGSADASP